MQRARDLCGPLEKKERGSELSTRPETVTFSYTLGVLCRLAASLSARVAHLRGSERLMVSHDFV